MNITINDSSYDSNPAVGVFEARLAFSGDQVWATAEEQGCTGPGWYFWDETWSYAYGPYGSREEAGIMLDRYAVYLNGEYNEPMPEDKDEELELFEQECAEAEARRDAGHPPYCNVRLTDEGLPAEANVGRVRHLSADEALCLSADCHRIAGWYYETADDGKWCGPYEDHVAADLACAIDDARLVESLKYDCDPADWLAVAVDDASNLRDRLSRLAEEEAINDWLRSDLLDPVQPNEVRE